MKSGILLPQSCGKVLIWVLRTLSTVTRNKVQNWPNAEVNTKLFSEAYKILKKSGTVVEVASLPARANINPVGIVIKEIPHLKKTKIRPILDSSYFGEESGPICFNLDMCFSQQIWKALSICYPFVSQAKYKTLDGKIFRFRFLPFGFQNCPVLFDVISRAVLSGCVRWAKEGVILTEFPHMLNATFVKFTSDEMDYIMSFPEFFDETKWVISIYFDDIFGCAENELLGRYILVTILILWTIVGIPYGEQKVSHPATRSLGGGTGYSVYDCPSPKDKIQAYLHLKFAINSPLAVKSLQS